MRRRDLLQRSASVLLASLAMQTERQAHADTQPRTGIDLDRLSVQRGDEGLLLSYDLRFELPRDLEQILNKGIAVVFLAEAEVFKTRWYWTDQSRSNVSRRWRLAYQPLTRQWKLSIDGLSRHYPRLSDALAPMRRMDHWRVGETIPAGDEDDYYVDFSFKLDTDELPRPLQIGLGGASDWKLAVQRRVALPASH